MAQFRRLSMNTSLKNARIFDDEAWEDDGAVPRRKPINKEQPCEPLTELDPIPATTNLIKKIKSEAVEHFDDTLEEHPHFKNDISIKSEKNDSSLEEGELEDTICEPHYNSNIFDYQLPNQQKVKSETSPVPFKLEFDSDGPVDKMFDESPYNNKLFENWKIKEKTPVKTESDEPSPKCSLKSARRTVFSRHSPYKKMESNTSEKRISIKSRLGPIVDSDQEDGKSTKRANIRFQKDMESDPEVLARREKQIQYGKNTIGYENYIQMVPRSERKLEDPKTPSKYGKYSRRGWEGLIKQWRIRLHKYDPKEDSA